MQVVVETPINLSKQQKELLSQIASENNESNYPIQSSFKSAAEDFLKE